MDRPKTDPGINVKQLRPGTRLMVETEDAVYEMLAVRPDLGLLEITSNDPQLHKPTVGQFVSSRIPPGANQLDWIGQGLCMTIRFRNGSYVSKPVLSAKVQGPTWHYDVF